MQFCFRLFTRGDFRFELLTRFNGLVRGRREAAHAFEQPLILCVKLAMNIMGDCPNRTDRFTVYIKRNKQSLVGKGIAVLKYG